MNDPQITQIATDLGIKTDIGRNALEIALQNVQLLDKKQQDYGPYNIGLWGEHGIAVRCTDKVMRLREFILHGKQPQNEPREDAYADLSNYGLIGQMISRGLWPIIE